MRKGFNSEPPSREELWTLIEDVRHLRQNIYVLNGLYESNPSHVPLLQASASAFFGILHGLLTRDIVSAIVRLIDHPANNRQRNLVLKSLTRLPNPHGDKMAQDLDDIRTLAKEIIHTRHKYLAHRAHEQALGMLPDVEFVATKALAIGEKMTAMVTSAAAILNIDNRDLFGDEYGSDAVSQLLNVLERAESARSESD